MPVPGNLKRSLVRPYFDKILKPKNVSITCKNLGPARYLYIPKLELKNYV